MVAAINAGQDAIEVVRRRGGASEPTVRVGSVGSCVTVLRGDDSGGCVTDRGKQHACLFAREAGEEAVAGPARGARRGA